jgi:hypothetical protein
LLNAAQVALSPMQDLLRDWRRWTAVERVLAAVITALAVGVTTLLAIDVHSFLG